MTARPMPTYFRLAEGCFSTQALGVRTRELDATPLVDDAAEKLDLPPKSGTLIMSDLAPFVANHELTKDFIEGRGTSRYGNKL